MSWNRAHPRYALPRALFADRRDAGRALARKLEHLCGTDPLVLALPRGGVPVAYEVAHALRAPLDIFLVRKLGVPGHEELAMGAIASGGVQVLNEDVVEMLAIPRSAIEAMAARETQELQRREALYRDGREPPHVKGKTVILVDDGLATGATLRAAIQGLRRLGPRRIVVAAPVGSAQSCAALAHAADEVICAEQPADFRGVGQWYVDFNQTSDDEVRELLNAASAEPA